MARKPRVEFDGACYHVIVRGNQRQKTFRDDDASMISRLYAWYETHRDERTGEKLGQRLAK